MRLAVLGLLLAVFGAFANAYYRAVPASMLAARDRHMQTCLSQHRSQAECQCETDTIAHDFTANRFASAVRYSSPFSPWGEYQSNQIARSAQRALEAC